MVMECWMISTTTAISSLCPTNKFTMNGDDYDQLQWHSDDITKPTLSEINAKINNLKQLLPMRLLRKERDRLLIKSDWTQGDDVPVGIKTIINGDYDKINEIFSH